MSKAKQPHLVINRKTKKVEVWEFNYLKSMNVYHFCNNYYELPQVEKFIKNGQFNFDELASVLYHNYGYNVILKDKE